jgi:hypothetical protein
MTSGRTTLIAAVFCASLTGAACSDSAPSYAASDAGGDAVDTDDASDAIADEGDAAHDTADAQDARPDPGPPQTCQEAIELICERACACTTDGCAHTLFGGRFRQLGDDVEACVAILVQACGGANLTPLAGEQGCRDALPEGLQCDPEGTAVQMPPICEEG